MGKRMVLSEDESYVKWFSELSNKDVAIAGGKGASLAEMYNSGFPVPPGYCITSQSFDIFLTKTGIKEKIKEIIENINDLEDTEELQKRSREIRDLIERQNLPKEMEEEIIESYHILGSEKIDHIGISQDALNILKNSYEPAFVSVRSSATTEDLADASFAGQQETFLNVKGDRALIENVKKCFSSLYTPRAVYYRHKKGFTEGQALLCVVVQKMVDSQKSGVMFTRDPVGNQENVVIEAVFGLGEGIVSGQIKPDNYVVDRNFKILSSKILDKKIAFVRNSSGENTVVKLSSEKSKSQVLTNSQILELARYGLKLEEHYGKAQDIEFAIDTEKTYIVQSRPITTLGNKKESQELKGNVIVSGLGSSPGIGVGVVKIIKNMNDLWKIEKGDVLVTEMTNPDMVVAMQKSVAIVTDEGGMTAHASIVSRELGIPCVVGTENATSVLKDGMIITVDGSNGKVYEGKIAETHQAEIKKAVSTERIKLKIIVDMPESAERAARSGIKYVGLTRIEGIIASSQKHPLAYEKNNTLDEYTNLLYEKLGKIAEHFDSMWIRSSDIRTDEFSSLEGAPKKEMNPMLGLHGIRFSLKHPKIFDAELLAIKKLAEKNPHKRFGVMFPQIISVDEVRKAKEHFNRYKLHNMDFGVMIETPAAVQIIDDICREGISFISFGTNDLTQFTLAIDREEEDVQYLYNELNPAIFSQIKRVIGACRRFRIETSICGQAGSKKEMIEFLFRKGINSVSVNADAAYDISTYINSLEEEYKKQKENMNNFKREEKIERPEVSVYRKEPERAYEKEENMQENTEKEKIEDARQESLSEMINNDNIDINDREFDSYYKKPEKTEEIDLFEEW